MWQAIRENPRAVFYAVLMHLVLLVLLVFSLDWTPKAIKPGQNIPIQAELVDSSKLKAIEEKKKAEQNKVEQEKQRKLEQEKKKKAEAAASKKAEIEAKKKAEVERKKKADLAAKQKAEEKKKAEQARKKKTEAERKKKAEAEARKKAEADARKKAEAEKQRKAEQAAKEQAAAEARQREAEQAMQAQIAEEQAQAAATHALSQYIPYIQQKIQRNWIRPAGSPPGMSCLILVKLIPGGEVVDARVVRSSGDALFDRSVETAVLKASPLPLPEDPAMFKYFREINFNFNPDN